MRFSRLAVLQVGAYSENVVTQLSRNTSDSKQETTAAYCSSVFFQGTIIRDSADLCRLLLMLLHPCTLWQDHTVMEDPREKRQAGPTGVHADCLKLLRLNAVWYEGLWVGRGPSWCSFREVSSSK